MWQRRGKWPSFWRVVVIALTGGSLVPQPLSETEIANQGWSPSEVAQAKQMSLMLHLQGNSETSQEWSYSSKTGSQVNPGAVIYCVFQTTVLQCQSHKAKGRHSMQKKTSISRHKTVTQRRGPDKRRTGAQCAGMSDCKARLQSPFTWALQWEMWRLHHHFFYVFKTLNNSFKMSIALQH